MKRLDFLIMLAILFGMAGCQNEPVKKQYFKEASEIELVKKAAIAFQNNDPETYRSCFADTARFWHNQNWVTDPGLTMDEQLQILKMVVSNKEYYRYEDPIVEMIMPDDKTHWVHYWAILKTKYIGDDVEITVPIHFAFSIVDNKIVHEYGLHDSLPFYLAEQRIKEASVK
ncbi:hypothetical protein [Maribellus mangrovi]|uniref:hypothetical protein n=1 Tax=Maribellus mangrovi TaxID=3133146 RepID=UPI0030ECAC2A